MPWLHFVPQGPGFGTRPAAPSPSSRQLLWPSRPFVHSFLRSAALHHVRSRALASRHGAPATCAHFPDSCCPHGLAAAPQRQHSCRSPCCRCTPLTGFHSASLRHTFTSVAFSPPAAHFFARLAPHYGCVQRASVRLIPSVHCAYGCSASLA